MNKKQILDFINKKFNNIDVIYLIKGGSYLYGTNTPTSDIDVFGIFIKNNNNIKDELFISTGSDNTKNTKDDIDIFLFSVDYILNNKKFNTKIIDLLFSNTNKNSIIYKDKRVNKILNKRNDIINSFDLYKNVSIYIMKQFHKYTLPGTNKFTFQFVNNYLCRQPMLNNIRLYTFVNDLMNNYRNFILNNSFPFDNNGNNVLNKLFITTDKFNNKYLLINNTFKIGFKDKRNHIVDSVIKKLNSFKNLPINFKDLSHVVRILEMMDNYLNNGTIYFPLKNKDDIIKIKYNKNTKFNLNNFYKNNLNKFNNLFKK